MRRSKMLPPAVRWLCLLFLVVHGVIGQLSVGEPDAFRLEDLEEVSATTQALEVAVGEEPLVAGITDLPPSDTTFASFEDAVTLSEEAVSPETERALEEEEISSVVNGTDFGVKIISDVDDASTAAPQLTRRILVSGTVPTTPAVPEASSSVSFSRPSSVVRLLSDPNTGWLPNYPSQLLQGDDVTRQPTLRFPTGPPTAFLGPTPTPSVAEPAATPVPSIVPSLAVSKVPVTQYFFDLTSASPTPPPGPLFNPGDVNLSGLLIPGNQDIDLNQPVSELASSIPELQSSAFMQTGESVSVTPTLPVPQTLSISDSPTVDLEIYATPTLSPGPTRVPPSLETEVVDNDLAIEDFANATTLVSDVPKDLDPETSGPRPPQSNEDNPEEMDGDDDTTTQPPVDTSSPLSPVEPNAVISEDPSGTGVTQPDPSATSPSPFMSESELASTLSTTDSSLGSIQPTTDRTTLQAANTSRTPLWMLLSQSMPSQSVNTESMHTTLTSPVVGIPVTESLTTAVPTVEPTDVVSGVPGEVTPDIDLVSSLLISSKLTSSNSDSAATVVDIPNTRPSLEVVPSSVPSVSLFSTESPSTENITDSLVSISPTLGHSDSASQGTTTPEPTATTVPLYDASSDDSLQPLDFTTPLPPVTTESSESVSLAFPLPDQNNSPLTPLQPNVTTPLNATVEYNESSEEPLIVSVPQENPSQQDSSSAADEDTLRVVPTKTDSASWTPVVEFTEESVDDNQVTPSSVLAADDASTATLLTPELTGGFIPIVSEATKSSPALHSELTPENANISITTAITALVADSTTALAKSHSTMLESSPSFTDSFSVQEPSLSSDRIPVSSVLSKDGLVSSNLLLSTTTFPTAKSEPTSVSLTPSFNVSVLTTQLPFENDVLESDTMTTNLEPSMVVFERFPSSPILVTETLPSTAPSTVPSTSLFPLPSSEGASVSPESSVTSVISSSTISPSLPIDPVSPVFQTTSSSSSSATSFPTSDLPPMVTPTVTEATATTDVVSLVLQHPEELPAEEEEEADSKEPSTKSPEEEVEVEIPTQGGVEEVTPEEETPILLTTTPAPLPPVTTPTTSTTTERDMISTKVSAVPPTSPSTTSTSSPHPPPTTPQSTITVTSMSEVMPSLTTSVTFPNGTVVERPLPYIRALVAYSENGFCQHKHNFRAMFAEWISQHMQEETSVSPSEIEFFNMKECGLAESSPEEPINKLPGNFGGSADEMEDNMNESLNSGETNVYFYVTRYGKINPNLTENFPIYPTELEISEELTYLRSKVSHLELVRPDGSTDSALSPEEAAVGTSVIVIIVIVTVVGLIIITALIFFMVVKRRGSTNNYYGRRCTPVSMDAYSMDSVSVYHSFRRKSKRRASGRSVKSYLNQAFDDPNGPSRPLNFAKLTHFISDIDGVYEEFATIPVNMPKYDELPSGVEDKNRYANVIPVPETRVLLKCQKDSSNSEYINANYVRGPRNESKYYIATQAPLDDTVADFWRMIWEQETRVVVMLTDFVEKGIDKCADYLPPSETLDCHRLYGDFQVTLKSRDMREKFVVSNVQLKNLENNLTREVAHMWFTGWPASGVPNEETAFISYILDIRRTRKKLRAKGPILVHCSPGTGRSGTFLACDLVMRQFEDQRAVDIPRTVYSIRRDRAGAVQTKEQYAFIYRVINLYASKLTTGNLDSL